MVLLPSQTCSWFSQSEIHRDPTDRKVNPPSASRVESDGEAMDGNQNQNPTSHRRKGSTIRNLPRSHGVMVFRQNYNMCIGGKSTILRRCELASLDDDRHTGEGQKIDSTWCAMPQCYIECPSAFQTLFMGWWGRYQLERAGWDDVTSTFLLAHGSFCGFPHSGPSTQPGHLELSASTPNVAEGNLCTEFLINPHRAMTKTGFTRHANIVFLFGPLVVPAFAFCPSGSRFYTSFLSI